MLPTSSAFALPSWARDFCAFSPMMPVARKAVKTVSKIMDSANNGVSTRRSFTLIPQMRFCRGADCVILIKAVLADSFKEEMVKKNIVCLAAVNLCLSVFLATGCGTMGMLSGGNAFSGGQEPELAQEAPADEEPGEEPGAVSEAEAPEEAPAGAEAFAEEDDAGQEAAQGFSYNPGNLDSLSGAAGALQSDAWKKTYLGWLKENPPEEDSESASYSLIYVNDDDVPEMIASTGYEAGGNILLGIFKGQVKEWQTNRLGLAVMKRKNLLDNADGHMGFYFDYVFRMGETDWESVASGEYMEENVDPGDYEDYADIPIEYFWNGERVSEAGYETQLERVFPDGQSSYWSSGADYQEMLDYLSGRWDPADYQSAYREWIDHEITDSWRSAYEDYALVYLGDEAPALIARSPEGFSVTVFQDGFLFSGPFWYFGDERIYCYEGEKYILSYHSDTSYSRYYQEFGSLFYEDPSESYFPAGQRYQIAEKGKASEREPEYLSKADMLSLLGGR